MPRLICTYRQFLDIIRKHHFELHRQGATSHKRYKGVVGNQVRFVDFAPHGSLNAPIDQFVLKAMIQQSGLPQNLFRH